MSSPTRPHRLLLLALVAAAVALLPGSLPSLDQPPALEAARPLADRVVIRRDTFGIPHIVGETEGAVALGFGYAQAEDHAVEMARRLVAARGESARYLGAQGLDNDLAVQRLGGRAEAGRVLATLDKTYREVLEGFAEGYNLYVRQHREALGLWAVEVTAADVLLETRGGASAVNSPGLVRALQQKYPADALPPSGPLSTDAVMGEGSGSWTAGRGPDGGTDPSVPARDRDAGNPLADADGSNAFALSGRKTTSGAPILLGNPHLQWQQLYWEAQVTVPGKLDFYGSTLVGLPWLRAGFNDRLGYVQTNNAVDTGDLFALPLDPSRPDHYRFGGKSRALARVEVAVEVRQDDGSMKTERRTYWNSHLGPIVHRNARTAFALRSSALDAWRAFEGFWRLSHSRSLADYMKTMSMRLAVSSNYTYADAAGNIVYLWNARLPKRVQDGTSYELDVPGDGKKYVWSRLHPTRELPQMRNPPGGYVQNANNPPWFVAVPGGIDQARYPAYYERGELALRPQLAIEMIGAREKFSVEEVKRLKFEPRLLLAERVQPALMEALASQAALSEALAQARDVLGAWDLKAAAGSRGAVLFQRFWETYRAEVRQPYAEPWDATRPTATPRGLANPEAALRHLAEAVTWTRTTYGSADVAWGDANRYRFGEVDLPGEGATGQLGAFRVQQFDTAPGGAVRVAGWADGDRQLSGFGDGWVLLVHFTRPVQAYSVLAYGQTTDRSSPHSRDQIRIFAGRDLRPVWFTEADVKAHLEREYRPQ